MNKLLLFLFLFFGAVQAQDTTMEETPKIVSKYSEKDIKVDDSVRIPLKFGVKLKDKYNSGEFQYEVKIAEKGAWDRFKEWLAHFFGKLFGVSDMKTSMNYVDIILQILAVIIIFYVIYLITKAILNKEGQWVFGKSTTKKIIEYHDIERNLQHVDFEKLIQDTLNSGDKRLAIRYYYLWILKKMSEKNLIEWNPEKTNSDYLYEIQSEKLRKEFNYVSYLYDCIWYGEFELEDDAYDMALKSFETTLQSIY